MKKEKLNKINVGIDDSTLYAESVTSKSSNSFMCVRPNKQIVSGQLDMYNYKLADIAHELDKINLNELTPIEALNVLVKLKGKIAG